jgi:hypothetical protein
MPGRSFVFQALDLHRCFFWPRIAAPTARSRQSVIPFLTPRPNRRGRGRECVVPGNVLGITTGGLNPAFRRVIWALIRI